MTKNTIEQKKFFAIWIIFEQCNLQTCNKLSIFYVITKFQKCKFTNISHICLKSWFRKKICKYCQSWSVSKDLNVAMTVLSIVQNDDGKNTHFMRCDILELIILSHVLQIAEKTWRLIRVHLYIWHNLL